MSHVLSIIGTLVVGLLGFLLKMISGVRQDLINMEERLDEKIESTNNRVLEKVARPDCIRDMDIVRIDIKEAIRDIKDLTRRNNG
jgi:hypothetical protein